MGQTVRLKDGTEITIRPLTKDDLDRSLAFFQELPAEDREYVRADVSKRSVVERRLREIGSGRVRRLAALVGAKIVADGAIELAGHEWTSHVGEMRLIVARPFQRKGLGMLMARELYALAASAKVEQIIVSVLRPQLAAHSIASKLGFKEEAVLRNHAKDRGGKRHDVILMRCDLEATWRELETFFAESDWQRTR